MSDAIDRAEVVVYGVSLAYKESGNCRLEANYAHQSDLDMVPLMMQQDCERPYLFFLIISVLRVCDARAAL